MIARNHLIIKLSNILHVLLPQKNKIQLLLFIDIITLYITYYKSFIHPDFCNPCSLFPQLNRFQREFITLVFHFYDHNYYDLNYFLFYIFFVVIGCGHADIPRLLYSRNIRTFLCIPISGRG